MLTTTLFCEVFFRVFEKEKIESISGEVDRYHLLSEENNWIVVKNKVFLGNQVIENNSVINKGNIVEIQVYAPSRKSSAVLED